MNDMSDYRRDICKHKILQETQVGLNKWKAFITPVDGLRPPQLYHNLFD